jgi:hypothetical protein
VVEVLGDGAVVGDCCLVGGEEGAFAEWALLVWADVPEREEFAI